MGGSGNRCEHNAQKPWVRPPRDTPAAHAAGFTPILTDARLTAGRLRFQSWGHGDGRPFTIYTWSKVKI